MGDAAPRSVFRICASAGLALFCALCGWLTLRLALAPDPRDADYRFRLWETRNGARELEAALALNPRYTSAWIARGLAAEIEGDRKTAEASLLRAAAMDHTYLPRWTLANFYLRAGDMPQFWNWARRAAGMAYDPAALFQLCWRASGDAREILDRAIPPLPAARRAYLDFLLRTDRLEAAGPLVDDFCRTGGAIDVDRLLNYVDAWLARKQAGPARKVWNALATRRLIPYGGGALTNGDLSMAPLGRGFDWRPIRVEGAPIFFDRGLRHMSLALSGRQPERCDLVEQYVPLEPAAGCRFRFRYRTRELAAADGLIWSVVDARSGAELGSGAVPASPDGDRDQTLAFSVPSDCDLGRILLRYRRPVGRTRAEGTVVFSGFWLEKKGKARAFS